MFTAVVLVTVALITSGIAFTLVQGALSKLAVAQSSAGWGFEIRPNMTEEDTVLVIALSRETTALDKDGNELEFITISKEDNPPQAQEMHIASIDRDL